MNKAVEFYKKYAKGYSNFINNYFEIKRESERVYSVLYNRELQYYKTKEEAEELSILWNENFDNWKHFNDANGTNYTVHKINGMNNTLFNIAKNIERVGSHEDVLKNMIERVEKSIEISDFYQTKEEMRKKHMIHEAFNYNEYLQTDYWKELRLEALNRDGHRCKLCNTTEDMQVHHRSYKNTWVKEKEIHDLVTLCRQCHEIFHKYSDIVKK